MGGRSCGAFTLERLMGSLVTHTYKARVVVLAACPPSTCLPSLWLMLARAAVGMVRTRDEQGPDTGGGGAGEGGRHFYYFYFYSSLGGLQLRHHSSS